MTQPDSVPSTGQLHLHGEALSPIHHGGDRSEGNKQFVRQEEHIGPEGRRVETPVISGNSIKHMIREGALMFALHATGLHELDWEKKHRDLFISGGTFGKGNASIRLDAARQLEEAIPALRVMGYAAGNYSSASKLNVDHWILACRENRRRLRGFGRIWQAAQDGEHPESGALLDRTDHEGGYYLADDFGTRHEPKDPNVNALLESDERKQLESDISDKKDLQHADKGDSLQMIYDREVVMPGSHWAGCIHYQGLDQRELASLASALSYPCEGTTSDGRPIYRVGGKGSVGLGKMAVRIYNEGRVDIEPLDHQENEALTQVGGDAADSMLETYIDHLREHKDDVREAVEVLI